MRPRAGLLAVLFVLPAFAAMNAVLAAPGGGGGSTTTTGDITAVNAGEGLLGGATSGSATLAINVSAVQVRIAGACLAGSSIRSISSSGAVTCEPDDGAAYAAGSGLLLNGTTFSVNTTAIQSRVTGVCAAGFAIRSIAPDGTVGCEADDSAAYTAGAGLLLSGGAFSVNTTAIQGRVAGTCLAGSSIRAIAADGSVTCEADDSGTAYSAGAGLALSGSAFALRDCASGEELRSGGPGTWTCAASDPGTAWGRGGNAGTTPGTDFLGTTDAQALELRVNGARGLRLNPDGGLAAGAQATAAHGGSFVWADGQAGDFASTASDQVLFRARNGMGLNVTAPRGHLHVGGNTSGATLTVSANEATNENNAEVVLAEDNDVTYAGRIAFDGATNLLQLGGYSAAAAPSVRGPWLNMTRDTGAFGLGRAATTNRLEVEGEASKTTAGSWASNSDMRIKTNVTALANPLAVIEDLRPVAFRYTPAYMAAHPSIAAKDYYNVLAQEYAQVFPDYVWDSGEGGILQVDTYPAQVHAIGAIQQLAHMVRERDDRIAALHTRLALVEQLLLLPATVLPPLDPYVPLPALGVDPVPALGAVSWSTTARLANGVAVVDFPPDFSRSLSSAAPVTVSLTPGPGTGPLTLESKDRWHAVVQGTGSGTFTLVVSGMAGDILPP